MTLVWKSLKISTSPSGVAFMHLVFFFDIFVALYLGLFLAVLNTLLCVTNPMYIAFTPLSNSVYFRCHNKDSFVNKQKSSECMKYRSQCHRTSHKKH